jgi:hypothetical protein
MNLDQVSKEHSVVRQPLTASCSSPAQENCAERNGTKDPHSVTACTLNIFPPKILGKPVVPPTSKAQDLKFAKSVVQAHNDIAHNTWNNVSLRWPSLAWTTV